MDVFNNILGDEEKIIQWYKPSKTRYVWITLLTVLLRMIFFVVLYLLIFFVIIYLTFPSPSATKTFSLYFQRIGIYAVIALCACFILGLSSNIVYICLRYQKTYYAITNKSILIRSGFWKPKYKKLSISNVHSVNIEVNFPDKLVSNTGSIWFNHHPSQQFKIYKFLTHGWYGGSYKKGFVFEGVSNVKATLAEIKSTIERVNFKI